MNKEVFGFMLTDLIKRILENERSHHVSNREEELTMPHVIDEKDSKNKYDSDIEALKLIYGVHFSTGFCIKTSLQDILRICPRERKRADAYTGLISYLKNQYGITLTIKSNKTKKGGNKNE